MRTLGTFRTKAEADQALAYETSQIARGLWYDTRRGEQPVGEYFRDWIASRGVLADSTRALYRRMLDRWIDARLALPARANGCERVVHLGTQPLASVTQPTCASGTPPSWLRLCSGRPSGGSELRRTRSERMR